jgi:hypothetical protein
MLPPFTAGSFFVYRPQSSSASRLTACRWVALGQQAGLRFYAKIVSSEPREAIQALSSKGNGRLPKMSFISKRHPEP